MSNRMTPNLYIQWILIWLSDGLLCFLFIIYERKQTKCQ